MLVVIIVAAAYITDIPILRPVRVLTDRIIGEVPRPEKSIGNCYECEASCAGQFEKCKETHCNPSGKKEVLNKCVERCSDQYRACYLQCTGKYGKEECPGRSIY
jgi:hypothetical protein